MKYHIIRNGEKLDDILFLYNLTEDELFEENKHIKVWNKLIPGIKLKIPVLTESLEQDMVDMEPFIEDYYPKIKEDVINEVSDEIIKVDKEEEQNIDEENKLNLEIEEKEEIIEDKKEEEVPIEVLRYRRYLEELEEERELMRRRMKNIFW